MPQVLFARMNYNATALDIDSVVPILPLTIYQETLNCRMQKIWQNYALAISVYEIIKGKTS